MSYIKATAEVVMLDSQDIVTGSYGAKAVHDMLENLKSNDLNEYNEVMSVLNRGEAGLVDLFKDLSERNPDKADRLASYFNEGSPLTDDVVDDMADLEAYLFNFCFSTNRAKYDPDSEDDSFDSEW